MENDFFNRIREKQDQDFLNYLDKMIKENRIFSWSCNDGNTSVKLTVNPKNMKGTEHPMRSISTMAEMCAIELMHNQK